MEARRNLSRIVLMGLAAIAVSAPTQERYWPPLSVTMRFYQDGLDTKYVMNFKNQSSKPIEQLRIQQVGVLALRRDFSPPYCLPVIQPGKTHTFTVAVRGQIVTIPEDDCIALVGTYRNGTQSAMMNLSFPVRDSH